MFASTEDETVPNKEPLLEATSDERDVEAPSLPPSTDNGSAKDEQNPSSSSSRSTTSSLDLPPPIHVLVPQPRAQAAPPSPPMRGGGGDSGNRQPLPVLIVPGFMSSGLEVLRSGVGRSWVGKRVWINLPSLGFHSLHRGGALRANEKKRRRVMVIDGSDDDGDANSGQEQESYSVTMHQEYERQCQCKNDWLEHISLSDDMQTERLGMKVRAIGGLAGVDYLMPGALTNHLSYVFGPVIKALQAAGYREGKDLDAAPYDWRVPPRVLESRDGYFTGMMRKVEDLYRKNNDTPVVLLCHSLGCKTAHYFLNFVLAHDHPLGEDGRGIGGPRWLDKYVHTYMPVGAPALGAPKAVRALVDGDKMGLDTFLSDEEGLVLGRSLGSGPWLVPGRLPPRSAPSIVVLRREGVLHVTILTSPVDCRPLLKGRESDSPKLRLCVVVGDEVLATEFKRTAGDAAARISFPEHFAFATPLSTQAEEGCGRTDAIMDDRFQIVLEEPGLGVAKLEKEERSGIFYSCLCLPCRLALGCIWCMVKYCLCLPCTLLYLILGTFSFVTLRGADVTAAAAGAVTKLASSRVMRISRILAGRDEGRVSVNVVHMNPYRKQALFSLSSSRPRAVSMTVRLRWETPSAVSNNSNAVSPIAEGCPNASRVERIGSLHRLSRPSLTRLSSMLGSALGRDGGAPVLHVVHKKKRGVVYEPASGGELLRRERLSRACSVIRDCYDADPLGPRSLSAEDAPPVKRVKAVYGINLPTEVGAVYRSANMIQVQQRVQKRFEVDTAACLQGGHGKYQIEKGIILETENTPQVVLKSSQDCHAIDSADATAEVIHRSGDGTVPYWSLQHCRTWKGRCSVSIEEIKGADHREILADARFHKILVDYVTQKTKASARNRDAVVY